MAATKSLDKPDTEALGGEDLRDASRYYGYLKALDTLTEVERELLTKSPRELRAIIADRLAGEKQREFTHHDPTDPKGWDEYARWSRLEPLEET